MAMSEMKIELPQQLIEDTVRAELIRLISDEKRDKLIEGIVKTALSQSNDRYGDQTVFQAEVNKMIRDEAYGMFKAWLDKNRDKIRDALFRYLNANSQKRLTEFCEKLANNITEYGITVQLKLEEKRG